MADEAAAVGRKSLVLEEENDPRSGPTMDDSRFATVAQSLVGRLGDTGHVTRGGTFARVKKADQNVRKRGPIVPIPFGYILCQAHAQEAQPAVVQVASGTWTLQDLHVPTAMELRAAKQFQFRGFQEVPEGRWKVPGRFDRFLEPDSDGN
jgi:hypothetical protein